VPVVPRAERDGRVGAAMMVGDMTVVRPPSAPAPQLLKPRLYRTDFKILNTLDVSAYREEFRALREDFERDWNRTLFKWTDEVNDLDYRPIWDEFYEFLNRSSIGEFSGCLLYSEVQKKLSDPDVAAIYKCMARDEGRHSSFLSWVMRHMGRRFDLGLLPKMEKLQYMHPKLIFITTYLSEIVGFYRYQNISDHLKANPEFAFHPIFRYFDDWCNDERRHSRFFGLMLRSQPQYLTGRLNHLAIKFFTLAVYITMYLRDCESKIYGKIGIDWEKYDVKVINETENAARRVWGLAIRTDSSFFLSGLRRMRRNNFANKAGRAKTGLAGAFAKVLRYARYGSNIIQYAKLMLQPSDLVEPLPRSEWLNVAPDPGEISGIKLRDAQPTTLRAAPKAAAAG
jgi:magnesium-protoporphyrin IX monomethyl ester (oxidative) cyclase